jgi:putative ubiquitin-RnfH superfamily antitoxin RatB of RatAB toxin-antitoxin module
MASADVGHAGHPAGLRGAAGSAQPDVGGAPARLMTVSVVYAAAPHQLISVSVQLPAGASARAALRASGLGLQLGSVALDGLRLGLWGRLCAADSLLVDGDRLELLRPLLADPMESRRQRLRRDGVRKVKRRA